MYELHSFKDIEPFRLVLLAADSHAYVWFHNTNTDAVFFVEPTVFYTTVPNVDALVLYGDDPILPNATLSFEDSKTVVATAEGNASLHFTEVHGSESIDLSITDPRSPDLYYISGVPVHQTIVSTNFSSTGVLRFDIDEIFPSVARANDFTLVLSYTTNDPDLPTSGSLINGLLCPNHRQTPRSSSRCA